MPKARDIRTVHLTDSPTMRVLAHSTRLRLLGLLRENGPQTAAQLGDVVDEAAGTISYHLGRLASVGLIEEAPDLGTDRRQRWWRSTHDVTSWEPADLLADPERLVASTTLPRTIVQHYGASLNLYLDALPTMSPEWVRAGASGDRGLRLTVDQLAALRSDLETVVDRYVALSEERAGDVDDADDEAAAPVTVIYQAFRRP